VISSRRNDLSINELMQQAAGIISEFVDGLGERRVGATATIEELRAAFGGPVPDGPADPSDVIAELAKAADPGLVATSGPRFFGFVIGGSVPASLAADLLTTGWDQNAGLVVASPAEAAVEEITGDWLAEMLALPRGVSFAFVTGGMMANFTGLAVARNHLLSAAGWDVETDGLIGAPPISVLVGEDRHVTVDAALRYLGLGAGRSVLVPCDDEGRMDPDGLRAALAGVQGPVIVSASAGNVNTGSFDPLRDVCDITHEHGGWVHVDGAFGLWAAAAPERRHLIEGSELADSWATDAHKWLNVPYDSGLVFTAHPDSHRAAMGQRASYLVKEGDGGARDQLDYSPEFSRRGRGFPVYAAIRSLGRSGIADMIEGCCRLATRFAETLGEQSGVEIMNDVVLNQVLVRFDDDDATTTEVIRRVQEDGTCWLGGATWKGRSVMRISVSNWSTTESDVDRSAAAILRSYGAASPPAGS
jgi:glutamate/tyrosine decarboxylase-like PLP-dependent enzyme